MNINMKKLESRVKTKLEEIESLSNEFTGLSEKAFDVHELRQKTLRRDLKKLYEESLKQYAIM